MLGKLIKYEFKATSRIFLPLLLLLVVLTPITKFVVSLDIFKGFAKIIPGLTLFFYGALIICICVSTFIFMIYRFYKNLLTEEGYLMFTLPTSIHSLVLSKAIVSFFWSIVCYPATVLSIIIVAYTPTIKDKFFYYYDVLANSLYTETKFNLSVFLFWTVVLIIVAQIYSIFYAYCSIAIGQLYGKHKILGAIAAAFVLYIALQIISSSIMFPLTMSIEEDDFRKIITVIYPASAAISVAITSIFYFVTTHLLQKKLNLN